MNPVQWMLQKYMSKPSNGVFPAGGHLHTREKHHRPPKSREGTKRTTHFPKDPDQGPGEEGNAFSIHCHSHMLKAPSTQDNEEIRKVISLYNMILLDSVRFFFKFVFFFFINLFNVASSYPSD